MSLESVVEDVRAQAEARREEIIEAAESRAEDIVASAEDDAESIRAEARESVEREIEQERDRRISSAKLSAKQERLAARREVLSQVLESVESELASLDEADRRELTAELVEAAAEEFDDGPVKVYVAPEDESLVADILEEYDGYDIAGTRECLGGIVAESDASRVRVNNTFDAILESVWEESLKDTSEILFDQRQ